MLAIPTPLPDELFRSHVGRTIRANGLGTERELAAQLAKGLGRADRVGHLPDLIELQSSAARVDLEGYVCRHTLVPLWRSITWDLLAGRHGRDASCGSHVDYGLRVLRSSLQFCPDCIRADIDSFGMAYWHREHQCLGVFWCARHRVPLKAIEDWRGQLHSPSRYLDEGWGMSSTWCDEMRAHRRIQQFSGIVDGLMDTHNPLPATTVTARLRQRAAKAKLSLSFTAKWSGTAGFLSDRLYEIFPSSWLAEVVPEFESKEQGKYMRGIDGVFDSTRRVTQIASYALACCALFESADDALGELDVVPVRHQSITATSGQRDPSRVYLDTKQFADG